MLISPCLESTDQSVQTYEAALEEINHLVLWISESKILMQSERIASDYDWFKH
jgi:hypothetical protein